MRERQCFLCEHNLPFNDYLATHITLEEFVIYTKIVEKDKLCKVVYTKAFKEFELVKIWQSDDIELFCCTCRRFLKRLSLDGNPLWKLLDWAKDKRLDRLKLLGIISQEQLVKLKNKK